MSAFIGIDVSKAHLDVAVHGRCEVRQFANSAAGHRRLAAWLLPQQPIRVVLEATGGYERVALEWLHVAGLPVARVNPRQARDFAKATGQLAKTDRLDARVLAHMAAAIEVPLFQPKEVWRARLAQWQQRRSQVVEMLGSETQRAERMTDPVLRRGIQRHLRLLEQELQRLNLDIAQQLQQPSLAPLRTLVGVGPVLQGMLASELPELGTLSGKAIAKLVGVAPLSRDSGQWRGPRVTWGGRAGIRKALYMSALTTMRRDPALRTFYQRLRERGKAAKVAIVAVMRKMLVILNARMRDSFREAQMAV